MRQEQQMASQPVTIETLLGVAPRKGDTRLGLSYSILEGLPVGELEHLAETVVPNEGRFKFRLICKATLDRGKKSGYKRLKMGEGDKQAGIAKVFRQWGEGVEG